jgi:NADH:ubiquinone oxidoreductase subunit 4 (subunit M)
MLMNSMNNLINLLFGSETTIVSLLVVFGFLCLLVVFSPRGPFFVEGKRGVVNMKFFRSVSLAITFVPLFWSLWLWVLYDGSGPTFQCICNIGGPGGYNVWGLLGNLHLSFGVDATGLALVLLTSAIFPLCVALMRTVSGILTFLALEWVILGSLLILDLLGFYIMFEASLILLFLLIARPERLTTSQFQLQHAQHLSYGAIDAAYKIVLYTMAGSLIFLPVIFILYSNYGTTNLLLLTCSNDSIVSVDRQMILGWGLLAVFAIKIPLNLQLKYL